MPPSPKSSTAPKKAGAPKAKGAVRAKSGCYTCRIRRKKCDERPDDLGRCETCVRLRLQCLGFGAKRPEWLRENNNVLDIREKIKTFLASQGMIKGHSGSGPRAAEQEPATLRLANEEYSSASESPPSQLLVLNDDVRQGTLSNVREQEWVPFNNNYEAHPVLHPSSQQRHESPFGSSHNEDSSYDQSYLSTIPHNSTSLVSWNPHSNATPAFSSLPTLPTVGSRFGASYTLSDEYYGSHLEDQVNFVDHFGSTTGSARSLLPQDALDDLANHYMMTVYELQYQLADKNVLSKLLFDAVQAPGFAREAARLLASVHCQRSQSPTVPALKGPPTRQRYDSLVNLLNKKHFDDDDALAALNVISTFLFDGGHGEWERWLMVVTRYSLSILDNRTRYHNYRDALVHCNEKDRFIITTAIWFDVLASVTTMKPPLLARVIDEIFNPDLEQSGVYESARADLALSPELSMMNVMGCENRVVWGLAQISGLSHWKISRQREGNLSVLELTRRASDIEAVLVPSSPPPTTQDDSDIPRILTSKIFRTSAIIYLRTIVSGDYPLVPEIMTAVQDAFKSLQAVSKQPERIRHVVVRSTVFAYYICGCLTNSASVQRELLTQLLNEGNVGNCQGIRELLKRVCHPRRDLSQPVPWRETLRDESMLVV